MQSAISYLEHQQQKRQIQNPVGYLYESIQSGWNLTVDQSSILPVGFNEWFEQMKKEGLVVAATTIKVIHHTLYRQLGWIPTEQLM